MHQDQGVLTIRAQACLVGLDHTGSDEKHQHGTGTSSMLFVTYMQLMSTSSLPTTNNVTCQLLMLLIWESFRLLVCPMACVQQRLVAFLVCRLVFSAHKESTKGLSPRQHCSCNDRCCLYHCTPCSMTAVSSIINRASMQFE